LRGNFSSEMSSALFYHVVALIGVRAWRPRDLRAICRRSARQQKGPGHGAKDYAGAQCVEGNNCAPIPCALACCRGRQQRSTRSKWVTRVVIGTRDERITLQPIASSPAVELHGRAHASRDEAESVELDLMHPALTGWSTYLVGLHTAAPTDPVPAPWQPRHASHEPN
jgi:hypothetical protein